MTDSRTTAAVAAILTALLVLTLAVPADAQILDLFPDEEPTGEPTEEPTGEPTDEPTGEPTDELTQEGAQSEARAGNPYQRADGNTVWPAGGQPAGAAFAFAGGTGRVDAASPTDAAVQVSRMRYPTEGSAPVVVLARDDNFADALSGSALTGYGPLLFTGRDAVTEVTRTEINRVLPAGGQVWILGGTAAIGQSVETELVAAGYTVVRLGGADRIETSLAIADHLWAGPFSPTDRNDQGMALIARAFPREGDESGTSAWADAIAAAAPAAARRIPVLLMDGDRGDTRVNAWLAAHQGPQGAEAVLLGGYAAISQQAEDVLDAAVQRYRIAGNTRAGTTVQAGQWGNAWTAHEADPSTPARFLVIDGHRTDGWAWGLAAAGIAADTNARMLLTSGPTVPTESLAAVTTCGGGGEVALLAVGPETVVPTDVITALRDRAAADCAAEDVNAGTLCNSIPVAAMNALMNAAWGVDEPILGGADVRLVEDRLEHDCTYRVDYLNASETGRGFAAVPSQWAYADFSEGVGDCSLYAARLVVVGGLPACVKDGFLVLESGVTNTGRYGLVFFNSLVVLSEAHRYPEGALIAIAEQIARALPPTEVLEAEVSFPR